MAFHDTYTAIDIHTPITFTFADSTARESATNPNTGDPYTSADLTKFAVQTDDNSVWMLTAITPTWTQIGGEGFGAGSGLTENGSNLDLGGTVTADVNLAPNTNDTHDFLLGESVGERYKSINLFGTDGVGFTSGDQTDYSSYAAGFQIGGVPFTQVGILTSSLTTATQLQIDATNGGVYTDGLASGGIKYDADYSANYTDRSLVDRAYVTAQIGSGNIYDTSGTLTGNRTVTGNSSDDLSFLHYNGTSSTYTLRSQLTLEDTDITISSHLGDGFGADIATQSLSMLNSGMEITMGIGDVSVLQNSNDWTFYEGTNTSSTSTVTVHGDGDHSAFDPYVTLHEGFATGNGTDTQPLICNFGKAARVQWNDGTRSVDTFHITGVVNASQVFQHMETSFQSTRHDYVDIDRWDWYFDTSGTTNEINIYNDDAGTTNILKLDDGGNLSVGGNLRVGNATAAGNQLIDVVGPSNANAEVHVESGDSAAYSSILNLESENAWELQSYHFINATSNQGQLEVRNDTAGDTYMTFSDVDKQVVANQEFIAEGNVTLTSGNLTATLGNITASVGNITASAGDIEAAAGDVKNQDGTLVVVSPSCVVGTSLAQTVTTSNAVVPLTAINVDGSGSEYTISTVSNNITFGNADGSKIYEITMFARYDLDNQGTTGSTRSYAILTPRLDSVAQTDYECWDYIREWQGGTNGLPNTSSAMTFQIQPTANQVLDFVVRGQTDTGSLTDFEIDGMVITVKRVA